MDIITQVIQEYLESYSHAELSVSNANKISTSNSPTNAKPFSLGVMLKKVYEFEI
jgi:hypothetical protein